MLAGIKRLKNMQFRLPSQTGSHPPKEAGATPWGRRGLGNTLSFSGSLNILTDVVCGLRQQAYAEENEALSTSPLPSH